MNSLTAGWTRRRNRQAEVATRGFWVSLLPFGIKSSNAEKLGVCQMGRVWEASDYYERILQIHESFQEWKPGWLLGAICNLLLRLTLTPSKTFWDLTLRAFPPLDTMSSYLFVPSVDDFFQCLWAYELPPLWFARVMVPQHILLILITAYGAQFEIRKKNTLW